MRIIQEFSNEPDKYIPSVDIALRRIEKLPLPYTGNKKKLIYQLHEALVKHNVEFNSVLDAFTGSATVAYLFKLLGKKVIANDLLTCSYVNAVAFVENSGIKLSDDEKEFLLCNNNSSKGSFVEDNYLSKDERTNGKNCRFNKFTLKECRHLDNFRANIDELCGIHVQGTSLAANAAVVLRLPFGAMDQTADILHHRKKQNKNYGKESGNHDRRIGIYYDDNMDLNFDKWFRKYVNDFTKDGKSEVEGSDKKIKRATFLANLQQHVLRDCFVGGRMSNGQVLAELGSRLSHQKNQLKGSYDNQGNTEMDFYTQSGLPGQGMKWWNFSDLNMPGHCLATNMDVIGLLNSDFCKVDCVYFDPPYGGQSSDYATMYRFLEEYIYSRPLEELPHIEAFGNRFVKKREYEVHFVKMLDAARGIPVWLFSYNDKSWKNIDEIHDMIKEYKDDVQVVVLNSEYRYLYRKAQGRHDNKSIEYLIIAR